MKKLENILYDPKEGGGDDDVEEGDADTGSGGGSEDHSEDSDADSPTVDPTVNPDE